MLTESLVFSPSTPPPSSRLSYFYICIKLIMRRRSKQRSKVLPSLYVCMYVRTYVRTYVRMYVYLLCQLLEKTKHVQCLKIEKDTKTKTSSKQATIKALQCVSGHSNHI